MSPSLFSHLASKANLPCPLAVCIDLNNPATLKTQPGLSLPPPALTNPGENKSHSLKPIKNEIIFLIKGRSFQMDILWTNSTNSRSVKCIRKLPVLDPAYLRLIKLLAKNLDLLANGQVGSIVG